MSAYFDLFSYKNLISAYYTCRMKKRLKHSSAEFEYKFEKEIIELEQQLKSRNYRPKSFCVFVVTEPKTREVFAASFRDRVVHHLLVNYLLPIFEPKFIFDSFACRENKGTHLAIERLSHFIKKITANNKKKAYFLQADIKNFFPSINHEILNSFIKRHIKNPDILWLVKVIIDFDCTENPIKKGQLSLFSQVPPHKSLFNAPKGTGLPIGNHTSQFFANIYLNELDQFIKHNLKCRYYVRYVDDFIILNESKEKLFQIKSEIENFLQKKLLLQLHPNKWMIQDTRDGIDALGYVIKPRYILARRRVIRSLKKKLKKFQQYESNKIEMTYIVASVNSYYAHFRHANSYHLRKNLWNNHFGILKKYLKPMNNYEYFKLT